MYDVSTITVIYYTTCNNSFYIKIMSLFHAIFLESEVLLMKTVTVKCMLNHYMKQAQLKYKSVRSRILETKGSLRVVFRLERHPSSSKKTK